ncbi:MAG: hypothetical protein KGL39_52115 [Patescibacteria group bacterium]|nr:hypothetical protein [Patescibacteria group bacterium]
MRESQERECKKTVKKNATIAYTEHLAFKTVTSYLQELGLNTKYAARPSVSISPDQLNDFINRQMGVTEIARELNITVATASKMMKDKGLTVPDKSPYGSPIFWPSAPCNHLKKILTEKKIIYAEEYKPLKNRQFRIDISFPSVKLGLEVNGGFHYLKHTDILNPKFQKRHDLIVAEGWELMEIPYRFVWDKPYVERLIEKIQRQLASDTVSLTIHR